MWPQFTLPLRLSYTYSPNRDDFMVAVIQQDESLRRVLNAANFRWSLQNGIVMSVAGPWLEYSNADNKPFLYIRGSDRAYDHAPFPAQYNELLSLAKLIAEFNRRKNVVTIAECGTGIIQ